MYRKFSNRNDAIVVEYVVSSAATNNTGAAVLPDRTGSNIRGSGRIHDTTNFSSSTTTPNGFLSQEIEEEEEEDDVNVNVNVSHDYMSLYGPTMLLEEENDNLDNPQLQPLKQPLRQPLKQYNNGKSLIVVPFTILSSNANDIVPANIAAVTNANAAPWARSVSITTAALSNDGVVPNATVSPLTISTKALSFAMKARLRAKKSYQRKIKRLKELPAAIQDQKRLEYNAGRKTKAVEKRDFEIGSFIKQSDDKSTWICRGCSKTYKSELGLIGHIKRTCDVYKQWKPKAERKRELEIDYLKQKSMDGMTWKCRGCCKKYKTELELLGHIKRNCIVYKKWKSERCVIEDNNKNNNNNNTATAAPTTPMMTVVQQQQQSVRSNNNNRSSLYGTAAMAIVINDDDNNDGNGGSSSNIMNNWQQFEQIFQQQQQQQQQQTNNLNNNRHQGYYDDDVDDEIMLPTPSLPNRVPVMSSINSISTTIPSSLLLSSSRCNSSIEPRPFNGCGGGLSTIDDTSSTTPPESGSGGAAATVANALLLVGGGVNNINKNNIMNNNNHLLNHHSFNRTDNYDSNNTLSSSSSSSFPLRTLMMAGREGSGGLLGTNHSHNHNHNQRVGGGSIRDDTAISFLGIAGRRAAAAAGGMVGGGLLSSLSEQQLHHNIRCKYSPHQIQMQIQHQMQQRIIDRHRILVLLQQQHQQQQY
jgi:hypothetical protein